MSTVEYDLAVYERSQSAAQALDDLMEGELQRIADSSLEDLIFELDHAATCANSEMAHTQMKAMARHLESMTEEIFGLLQQQSDY